jgi:crystallin alpha B
MFSLTHNRDRDRDTHIIPRDPLYLRDPFHQYHRLRREMDDLLAPAMHMMHHPRVIAPQDVTLSKDRFEVKMDVQQFAPEELNVKMVDKFVIVEAKHEERPDEHGFIARHFVRKYAVPDDVKLDTITCNLSSDGVLELSAPRMIEEEAISGQEKGIPITYTGRPAIRERQKHSEERDPESNQPKAG